MLLKSRLKVAYRAIVCVCEENTNVARFSLTVCAYCRNWRTTKNAVDRFLLYRKWMRWAGLCTFRTFLEQQQYTYKKKFSSRPIETRQPKSRNYVFSILLKSTLEGDRILEWKGSIEFKEEKNGIEWYLCKNPH